MTRRVATVSLAGIGILFLVLTVNPLLFQSYWENEADYILHARVPIREISRSLVPDQSVVYYLLLHGWMRLFGSGEATTRSLSVLFSLAALYFLYRLSVILFRDRRIGVLAVFLSAISSFLIEFSQETKHWTLFVFLTLSSFYFLYRWFEKDRLRDFFAFLSLGILNLCTCLYAFFVFPLQLVFVIIYRWWGSGVRSAIQFAVVASCIFVMVKFAHLWAGFEYVNSRGAQWGLPQSFPGFFAKLFQQLFYYTEDGRLPPMVQAGLALGYLFFLLGLWRMRLANTLMISLLFLLPLAVSYHIAGSSSIRNRYFIHLIPLFWLSTSVGIFSIKPVRLRWLTAGLILCTALFSLANYFKFHRKEDWKSAVEFLAPRLQKDDMVIVTPYWVKAGFEFYSPFRFLAQNEVDLGEISNFKHAWVLSAYGDAEVKDGQFSLSEQEKFHKISLRGFDLTSPKKANLSIPVEGFDFRRALESARTFIIPFNGTAPILFPYFGSEAFYLGGEEKGKRGEGLLYDYWSRYPLSPGSNQWNVVSRTVQKSGGVLREAIWLHPALEGATVIRYPKIRLGRKLVGFYGITDLAVEHRKGPVRFTIYVGEEKVFEVLKGNSAGWKEFEIDTSHWAGQEADISFRTEAVNTRWRHFCFNAYIP